MSMFLLSLLMEIGKNRNRGILSFNQNLGLGKIDGAGNTVFLKILYPASLFAG